MKKQRKGQPKHLPEPAVQGQPNGPEQKMSKIIITSSFYQSHTVVKLHHKAISKIFSLREH